MDVSSGRFIVDRGGIIRYSEASVGHTVRPEPQETIGAYECCNLGRGLPKHTVQNTGIFQSIVDGSTANGEINKRFLRKAR